MLSDLRYAVRSLCKTPGFTLVAILTLALGIGLVTVQFSFVYGAMIKGLPFEGAERIQAITTRNRTRMTMTSVRHFTLLRDRQTTFESLGAYRGRSVNVSGDTLVARRYPGVECTADVFTMTGVAPLLGRPIQPADNRPGAARVLVLAEEVWRTDFGADPQIVGRALQVDAAPATVIGVMPAGFGFPVREKAWSNLVLPHAGEESWNVWLDVVGRLRPDVTLAQARTELAVIAAEIARQAPGRENFGTAFEVAPFARRQVSGMDNMLWALMAMVVTVLALACLNVANLVYVRCLRQRHEFAVRLALGASRGRLIRQTLTLSLLLALSGAACGALLAAWAIPLVNAFLTDPQKPYWVALDLDLRVLGAVAVLTVAVGIVAGLLPALRTSRIDPLGTLHGGGAVAAGTGMGRISRLLTLAQVILSTAVLIVAVVLSRGVHEAAVRSYPGDAGRLLVASTVFAADQAVPARDELLAQAETLPGVACAALTTRDPDRGGSPTPVEIDGHPVARDRRDQVATEWITPDYFRVFALRVRTGRLFTAGDRPGSPPVVIVNESFARRYWPGEDPIGRRCRFEDAENTPQWHTVIGVVPDLPVAGIGAQRHAPGAYLPLHESAARRVNLVLVGTTAPLSYVRPVQRLLQEIAPHQPFQSITTLDDLIARRLQLPRVISSLAGAFGGAAALLATVGIFSVTGFVVERRRREFGVRIALGAPLSRITTQVLTHGAGQLALGLPLGALLGWLFSQPLQRLPGMHALARASAPDVVIVAALIAFAVLVASWLPARRATRVNPIEALRAE